MKRRVLVLCMHLSLVACASSNVRTMGDAEIKRHGLTGGVLYDVPLCPIQVNAQGASQVTGPCEYVTCEPDKGKIVCRAYKKRN